MDSALYQMSINSKIKYSQQLLSNLLTNLWYQLALRLLAVIYLNNFGNKNLPISKS